MKLYPITVQQIKEKYLSGKTTLELAKEYDVSAATILNKLKPLGVIRSRSERRKRYTLNENFFAKIDSAVKAQILGFLFADGYNDETRHFITVTLHNKDEEYLKKVLLEMQSSQPIKVIKQNYVNICFKNRKLSKDLALHGCIKNKSLILKYPILSKEYEKDFIRGYFEGDGGLFYSSKYNRLSLSICGTKDVLDNIAIVFKREINVKSYIYKRKNIYILYLVGNKNIIKTCDWIYDKAPFYMARKHDVYVQHKGAAFDRAL